MCYNIKKFQAGKGMTLQQLKYMLQLHRQELSQRRQGNYIFPSLALRMQFMNLKKK